MGVTAGTGARHRFVNFPPAAIALIVIAVRAVDATNGEYPQFLDPYMFEDADRLHARWIATVAHPVIAAPQGQAAVKREPAGKQIVDRIRDDVARAQTVADAAIDGAQRAAMQYLLFAISVIVPFVIAAGAIALWIEWQQTLEPRRFRQEIQKRPFARWPASHSCFKSDMRASSTRPPTSLSNSPRRRKFAGGDRGTSRSRGR